MNFTHDKESGALYIKLRDGSYSHAEDFSEGADVYLDVDADGNVLGLEALAFEDLAQAKEERGGKLDVPDRWGGASGQAASWTAGEIAEEAAGSEAEGGPGRGELLDVVSELPLKRGRYFTSGTSMGSRWARSRRPSEYRPRPPVVTTFRRSGSYARCWRSDIRERWSWRSCWHVPDAHALNCLECVFSELRLKWVLGSSVVRRAPDYTLRLHPSAHLLRPKAAGGPRHATMGPIPISPRRSPCAPAGTDLVF